VFPVTVIVVGVADPTGSEEGLRSSAPTVGLLTGSATAADVPPPGAGFTAVSDRLPVAAKSEELRVTLTWVALTSVVERALPFTSITVDDTKPVPETTMIGDAEFTVSVAGLSALIVGTGFGAVMAMDAAVDVPPPGVGFTAVTERLPVPAKSADVSVTLT